MTCLVQRATIVTTQGSVNHLLNISLTLEIALLDQLPLKYGIIFTGF